MKLFVVSTLLMVAAAAVTAYEVDYTGHMVIRTTPETEEQLRFLRNLQSTTSTDFWKFPRGVRGDADIHVSPDSYHGIARSLAKNKLEFSILISDIGELIKLEQGGGQRSGPFDYNNYHTYDEILDYLDELSTNYPTVSWETVGTTIDGNDIIEVTVSSDGDQNKQVIFFDCNIHAREWITTPSCIWMIENLASKFGTDGEVDFLLNRYNWKFIPVANPDGYNYSQTYDRAWKKNRSVDTATGCIGVDLDRNFVAGFGGEGSSNFPCSEVYRGTRAFSEPESAAVRDLLARNRGHVKAAFSFHSYGQLWLSPYGYRNDTPLQYAEMERVMDLGVAAIEADFGTKYKSGSIANAQSPASGVATDHYYVNEGIIYSYKLELREPDTYIVPPEEIVPTATEAWNGIKAAVRAMN